MNWFGPSGPRTKLSLSFPIITNKGMLEFVGIF
jgi:hypothetical protein